MRIRKRYIAGATALIGVAGAATAALTTRRKKAQAHYKPGDEVVSRNGRIVGAVISVLAEENGEYVYEVRDASTGFTQAMKHAQLRRKHIRGLKP